MSSNRVRAYPERIRRLRASVGLLRQAMSEGRMIHDADDAYPAIHQEGLPLPAQVPPPLLIGGGGRQLLAFAAREADIVGINPRSLPEGVLDSRDVVASAVDRKIGWLRESAGARWSELEINVALYAVDPEFHRRATSPPARPHGVSEPDFLESPHFLAGDVEEMIELLHARRERWNISYIALRADHLGLMRDVIRRLASSRPPA